MFGSDDLRARVVDTVIHADSVVQMNTDGRAHPSLGLPAGIATGPATPAGDPAYYGRLEARERFRRLGIGIMAENGLDVLHVPDVLIAAPTCEEVRSSQWSCSRPTR